MAIVNRSLDASEQIRSFHFNQQLVATGVALNSVVVPSASVLRGVRVAATGISGSPTLAFTVNRFIPGAGATSISGGATTLAVQAVGTSGVQSMVLAAAGSTFLNLLPGDVITLTSGGANSAVAGMAGAVVLQALQDIRTTFGI